MPDHSGLEQQQELTVYGVCATRRAPRLVLTHDPAITDRVGGQDRSQTAFHESSAWVYRKLRYGRIGDGARRLAHFVP
jgi:hypothetical protein